MNTYYTFYTTSLPVHQLKLLSQRLPSWYITWQTRSGSNFTGQEFTQFDNIKHRQNCLLQSTIFNLVLLIHESSQVIGTTTRRPYFATSLVLHRVRFKTQVILKPSLQKLAHTVSVIEIIAANGVLHCEVPFLRIQQHERPGRA